MSAPARPNILFLFTDDQRFDAVRACRARLKLKGRSVAIIRGVGILPALVDRESTSRGARFAGSCASPGETQSRQDDAMRGGSR